MVNTKHRLTYEKIWGVPKNVKWGYPNSWMVYFMENPHKKWMIQGYPFRKPPYVVPQVLNFDPYCQPRIDFPMNFWNVYILPWFINPGLTLYSTK